MSLGQSLERTGWGITHLIAQTEETRVTNTGATRFPLNLLRLLGCEFYLSARAHPATGDGANEVFPTKMTAGGFVLA